MNTKNSENQPKSTQRTTVFLQSPLCTVDTYIACLLIEESTQTAVTLATTPSDSSSADIPLPQTGATNHVIETLHLNAFPFLPYFTELAQSTDKQHPITEWLNTMGQTYAASPTTGWTMVRPVLQELLVTQQRNNKVDPLEAIATEQAKTFQRIVAQMKNITAKTTPVVVVQAKVKAPTSQVTIPTAQKPQTVQPKSQPEAPAAAWQRLLQTHQIVLYPSEYAATKILIALVKNSTPQLVSSAFKDQHVDVVVTTHNGFTICANQKYSAFLPEVTRILQIEESRIQKNPASKSIWKYDQTAHSIQDIDKVAEKSKLTPEAVVQAVAVGMHQTLLEKNCPPQGCRGPQCYFFDYSLARCAERKAAKS